MNYVKKRTIYLHTVVMEDVVEVKLHQVLMNEIGQGLQLSLEIVRISNLRKCLHLFRALVMLFDQLGELPIEKWIDIVNIMDA